MSVSIFNNQSEQPSQEGLDAVLGDTAILLKTIEENLINQFGERTIEWKFYGKKAGWTLAVAHQGRRVFHLIPQSGSFTVVFTLGKQAVAACQGSRLPKEILTEIEKAREYAEGKSFRLDVTTMKDVSSVQKLVAIMLS